MSVHIFKALVILSLGGIMVLYNNCGSPFGTSTPLYFSSNIYGGSAGISYNAFGNTVYPITRANCASCHATQQPEHASKNLELAHDSLVAGFKVNFSDIPNSRMVKKLRDEKHNCWGDCESNAQEMEEAIFEWNNTIKKSGTAIPTTPTNMGKILTAESLPLLAEFANAGNAIRNNVANLGMEPAMLNPPMQRVESGIDGTYLWVPNALNNTLPADSASAGRASINFTVRSNSNNYKVWGLVNAPNENDNGFYVNITTSMAGVKEWEIPVTQGWEWRELTGNVFNLTTGVHTIEIRQRKDGTKIKQIVVTSDNGFNANSASELTGITLSYDVSEHLKVPGMSFKIDLMDYDPYSYKFQNPRLVTTTANVQVKNVKLLVNKGYNPQHATFNLIDKIATPADGRLSEYAMLVIKEKGIAQDKISFSFGTLKIAVGSTTGGSMDPMIAASQEAFRTSVYAVSRTSCVACHTGQVPPHAHDDYLNAYDVVTTQNLVNFDTPATSRLVTKTRGRHNCGTQVQCDAIATQFVNAITEWAKNRP